MKRHWLSILVILTGLIGSSVMAQNKDLTGTWSLNVEKSFMGSDHPSNEYQLTKKIEQKDGLLSITDSSIHATMAGTPLADTVTVIEFAPDGKDYAIKVPSPFPGIPEMPGKVSAVWQGCTLMVHEVIPAFGSVATQRLFLSEDRSELIVLVEGHSSFMDTEQRLVFERKN